MKFLIDEDVPVKVLKHLNRNGHDAVRVESGSKDKEVAKTARKEDRILITLDKESNLPFRISSPIGLEEKNPFQSN